MRIRKRQQAGPSEPETQKQEDRQEVNGQAAPAEQVEPADPAATVEPEVVEIDRAYLLQQEVEELKLKMQQTLAEAQNMRKRTLLQMEDARKYAAEPLVKELLKVCDSFARAIASAEANPSFESLLDGVKAVERQLAQALKTASVERIPSVGETFDPSLHDAIDVEYTDEHEDETVVAELQTGYTMHGRVVRPAQVKVSKKP